MRVIAYVLGFVLFPTLLTAQVGGVHVTEVGSTLGRASFPFGTINDLLALPDGRVLVADDLSPAVWIWDPSSSEVKRIARDGEGPGEVRTPTQLARRPEGGFALYDVGHGAVLLYSTALEFQRGFQIGLVSNPKDFLVFGDGTFLLAGGRLRETTHLQKYDGSGARLEVWGDPAPGLSDPTTVIQTAGGALRRGQGGEWFFVTAAPYRILEFASSDLRNPSLLVEDLNLVHAPTDEALVQSVDGGGRSFRWWFDRTTGLVNLPDGHLLTVVTRFYSGDSVWTVHDPKGAVTHRSVVERAYHLHDRLDDDAVICSYRDPETDEWIAVILNLSLSG